MNTIENEPVVEQARDDNTSAVSEESTEISPTTSNETVEKELTANKKVDINYLDASLFKDIKEIDKINAFVKDYENLSVILINTDKAGEVAKVKRLVNTKKYPIDNKYHIVMDYNQKLSRSFNAQPIPLTLITKNNQIIYRKRGFNIGDEVEIKNIIEQVIFE